MLIDEKRKQEIENLAERNKVEGAFIKTGGSLIYKRPQKEDEIVEVAYSDEQGIMKYKKVKVSDLI